MLRLLVCCSWLLSQQDWLWLFRAEVLTNRRRGDLRPQNVRRQIARNPKDAIVNMQPGVGQGVEL